MTPEERATCQAALEAAEKAAAELRAALAADDARAPSEPAAGSTDALRIKQVAHEYGVSEKTARRWARRSGFRRGGVLFIRRAEIDRIERQVRSSCSNEDQLELGGGL
jgi:hypothetical protein